MAFTPEHFQELIATFQGAGLDVDHPGFYDAPEFLPREQQDPTFLEKYAEFVESRDYTQDYLQESRVKILTTTQFIHDNLVAEGRLGAC